MTALIDVPSIDVPALMRAVDQVAKQHEPLPAPDLSNEWILPGDVAAAARVMRAKLTLRLRDELGCSQWGAEHAARRVVGRALLEVHRGVTDPDDLAAALNTSRASLDRDSKLISELDGPR
jgi:hypothetical protein